MNTINFEVWSHYDTLTSVIVVEDPHRQLGGIFCDLWYTLWIYKYLLVLCVSNAPLFRKIVFSVSSYLRQWNNPPWCLYAIKNRQRTFRRHEIWCDVNRYVPTVPLPPLFGLYHALFLRHSERIQFVIGSIQQALCFCATHSTEQTKA